MQRKLSKLTFLIAFGASTTAFSASESKCHIRNPPPLLQKKAYQKSNYDWRGTSDPKAAVKETVTLQKNLKLTIEQKGCEDKVVTFSFDFLDQPKEISKSQFLEATSALRDLKLAADSFVTQKELAQLTKEAEEKMQRDGVEKLSGFIVVLHTVDQEVLTDVEILKTPKGFSFLYRDRP